MTTMGRHDQERIHGLDDHDLTTPTAEALRRRTLNSQLGDQLCLPRRDHHIQSPALLPAARSNALAGKYKGNGHRC
jgi:hypothetical protein